VTSRYFDAGQGRWLWEITGLAGVREYVSAEERAPDLRNPSYYWGFIRPQFYGKLVEPILQDRLSRRALLLLDEEKVGHAPCYTLFHALMRDEELTLMVYARSMDEAKSAADYQFFRWLAAALTRALESRGVKVFSTRMMVTVGSYHWEA